MIIIITFCSLVDMNSFGPLMSYSPSSTSSEARNPGWQWAAVSTCRSGNNIKHEHKQKSTYSQRVEKKDKDKVPT